MAMLKSIEFSNVLIFEQETRRMPIFVLHELSHAYHARVLGEHAGISAAYARALANKSYDCVERRRGPGQPNTFERAEAAERDQGLASAPSPPFQNVSRKVFISRSTSSWLVSQT
ncbi:hypothetical protein JGU66_31195 [Myxococcaceae bacterium JPH2]|nr:hypothetical protein [Myxococcaceae bacterium JPH2]